MKNCRTSICVLAGIVAYSGLALAGGANRGEGPEDYRIEVKASVWRMNTDGALRADGTPVDLVSDLGVGQRKLTYDGEFVFRFGRKHRLVVEGRPISIRGLNTVNRDVTYFGENYSVSETLKSSAEMNYIYAGFHHDWMRGKLGRIGSSVGAAYLGLSGSVQALQSGVDKKNSTPFGLPLTGFDFRLFPIPGKRWIEIEGGVRGLSAGSYGHWIEGSASAGGRIGPIGALVGYREMLVNFHQTGVNANGLNFRFRGPMVSLVWSW
jgi:hypothetical protein